MALPKYTVNVGVLGHVDSGKTSLVKRLSTTASTAAFDKNPQSQERGITLDLGFSSFVTQVASREPGNETTLAQYTLVDCPGHASLIKTIIGGAQIIDMMLLVVDVTKGMQTQTAECLVIGEILCDKMMVVLNKVDLLPKDKRSALIEKMSKRMSKTLASTRLAGSPIVAVAANPEGEEPIGTADLVSRMTEFVGIPQRRNLSDPFVASVDHCFSIRGQGTVLTGTVLSGSASVNDTIEIPELKQSKKIKSLQIYRQPVQKATQGDRVGILLTQFNPSQFERGFVSAPGHLRECLSVALPVSRISYYKHAIRSKAKFHTTIGHSTVLATANFFTSPTPRENFLTTTDSNPREDFLFANEVLSEKDVRAEYEESDIKGSLAYYTLLEFDKPVICSEGNLVICSKLDMDVHTTSCRLAFYGRVAGAFSDAAAKGAALTGPLRVYKNKSKEGVGERLQDSRTVIVRNLFKKESNLEPFVGLKVSFSTGDRGVIEGTFGKSGKTKIGLQDDASQDMKDALGKGSNQEPPKVFLTFKKYLFHSDKILVQ